MADVPAPGEHTEHEDQPWTVAIPDHPARTDSPEFVAARSTLHKILQTLVDPLYGPEPVQAHHGGSLWVHDGTTWRLYLNECGIEWSSQFSADPARVERLRQNAVALYAAFPQSMAQFAAIGYPQAAAILNTPITDTTAVAGWTDSIFNACVPLPAGVHTGVLSPHNPQSGGQHHYPKPVTDIQHFKRDDFDLWVVDPASGHHVAVTPTEAHDGSVEVQYATHGTALSDAQLAAHAAGRRHILPPDHPIARTAHRIPPHNGS